MINDDDRTCLGRIESICIQPIQVYNVYFSPYHVCQHSRQSSLSILSSCPKRSVIIHVSTSMHVWMFMAMLCEPPSCVFHARSKNNFQYAIGLAHSYRKHLAVSVKPKMFRGRPRIYFFSYIKYKREKSVTFFIVIIIFLNHVGISIQQIPTMLQSRILMPSNTEKLPWSDLLTTVSPECCVTWTYNIYTRTGKCRVLCIQKRTGGSDASIWNGCDLFVNNKIMTFGKVNLFSSTTERFDTFFFQLVSCVGCEY